MGKRHGKSTTLVKNASAIHSLPNKKRQFVAEYLLDFDAKRAAKDVGYKNPSVMACHLLSPDRNPDVVAAIGHASRKALESLGLDLEQVLKVMAYVILRDPADFIDENGILHDNMHKMPARARQCIDGFKVKQELDKDGKPESQTIELKLVPKAAMIELAMKYFGALAPEKRKIEHSLDIDWDKLYKGEVPDVIEEAIALEEGDK